MLFSRPLLRHVAILIQLLAALGASSVLAQSPSADAGAENNAFGRLASLGVGFFVSSTESGRRIEIAITPETYTKQPVQIIDLLATVREPFTIVFYSGVRVDDAACQRLALMPNLKGAVLPPDGFTDNGVAAVADSTHLRDLSLSDRNLSVFDIGSLGSIRNLTHLTIDRATLTPANWEGVGRALGLKALSCQSVTLTPDAWKAIQGLPELRSIKVGGRRLSGNDVRELSKLERLEEVSLLNSRLSAEDLRPLAHLTHCKTLDLQGTHSDQYSLHALAEIGGLQEIRWPELRARGQQLEALARLANLRRLDFSDSQLDDDGLRIIAAFPSLRSLHIARCNAVSDEGLLSLANCPQLRELSVSSSTVTDAGFSIAIARMHDLRSLAAYGMSPSVAAISHFAERGQLEELRLWFPPSPKASDTTSRIMATIGKITSLQKLEVSGLPQTDETLSAIAQLPLLQDLALRGSGLNGKELLPLAALPALRTLDLSENADLDDEVIDVVRRFPQLEILSLDAFGVSAGAMSRVDSRLTLRKWPIGTIACPGEAEYLIDVRTGEAVPVVE